MATKFRPPSQVRDKLNDLFPNLAKVDWRIKSPSDDSYQCIAWAASYRDRIMWPSPPPYWWFPEPNLSLAIIPEEAPVDYFLEGFKLLGYEKCADGTFEIGYQKLAIYANHLGATHMARQHFLGRGWLSKLGGLEDILHPNLEDIEGDLAATAWEYGEVAQIIKRSWWAAFIRLCVFRSSWAAFRFWVYRLIHPSWIWDNIFKQR